MNYNEWKKEELKKNPSADTSKEAFSAYIAEQKLIKKRWKEHEKAFTPQPNREPIKGCSIWHAEESTSILCSRCGLPMEKGDSPNPTLCGECFLAEQ